MAGGTVIGGAGRTRARLALGAAAALCALTFVTLGERSPAAAGISSFVLDDIGDFRSPVYVDDAPGATGLLFVVEQRGKIVVMDEGIEQAEPFLDIRDQVQFGGEEGLLSVAFHPDYDTNRRFYVYYTTNTGDIRVDQFKRKRSDFLRASMKSREKVIKINHPSESNHNGGQLQFGPDGSLYMGTGDGGGGGDPGENAQDPDSLLGKLLRLDPRGDGGYDAPADNPFVGRAGRDEIMATGLRNPWRYSFDSATGDIVIADVGQDEWEEIDHETNTDLNGASFGWDRYEGLADFEAGDPIPPDNQFPIKVHPHDEPDNFCSITGGYVVHDPQLPSLAGQYIYSDLCQGDLLAIQIPSGANGTAINLSVSSPSSFGEGENGQIYVVSHDGDVFALEPGA
jgi:glucose/arabinose dehydrogenase